MKPRRQVIFGAVKLFNLRIVKSIVRADLLIHIFDMIILGQGLVPHIHLACVDLREADENYWALGHDRVDNEHRDNDDEDGAEGQAEVALPSLHVTDGMLHEEAQ